MGQDMLRNFARHVVSVRRSDSFSDNLFPLLVNNCAIRSLKSVLLVLREKLELHLIGIRSRSLSTREMHEFQGFGRCLAGVCSFERTKKLSREVFQEVTKSVPLAELTCLVRNFATDQLQQHPGSDALGVLRFSPGFRRVLHILLPRSKSLVRKSKFGVRDEPYGLPSDPEFFLPKLSVPLVNTAPRVNSGFVSDPVRDSYLVRLKAHRLGVTFPFLVERPTHQNHGLRASVGRPASRKIMAKRVALSWRSQLLRKCYSPCARGMVSCKSRYDEKGRVRRLVLITPTSEECCAKALWSEIPGSRSSAPGSRVICYPFRHHCGSGASSRG
jgi:hypothetical protein